MLKLENETRTPWTRLLNIRTSHSPLRPTWSQATLVLLLVSMLVAVVAYFKFNPHTGVFHGFNPYMVAMANDIWYTRPVDRRAFLFAHKVFLIALGLEILIVSQLPQSWKQRLGALRSTAINAVTITILSVFLTFSCLYVIGFEGRGYELSFGLLFLPAAYLFSRIKMPDRRWPALLVAALLIAVATIPGLFVRPDFSLTADGDLLQIQQHYAVCVSFADRLSKGLYLGPETWMHYGVMFPTLIGLFEKISSHILDFGKLVRLVEVSQIAVLIAICSLIFFNARRHYYLAICAFLAIVPWYHCNQLGILYPNHSGWRLIGIFGGLSLICLARRMKTARLAFLMGLIGGLCTLINIETGLVLCVGFALMLFLLRARDGQSPLRSLAVAACAGVAGGATSLAAYCLMFYCATGYFPGFLDLRQISILLSVPQIITIGTPPAFVSYVMFIHASYILLRTAIKRGEDVTFQHALRACISFVIIVWEIYYWNRAYYPNLAAIWCLYSVLLVDYLRVLALGLKGRRPVMLSAGLCAAVASLVVVPYVAMTWESAADSYVDVWKRLTHTKDGFVPKASVCSGVLMPEHFAAYVCTKSEVVKTLSAHHTLNSVTMYSLLVPKISGYCQQFSSIDPYFGVNTAAQHEQYCQALMESKPQYILIDDYKTDSYLGEKHWYQLFHKSIAHHIQHQYEYVKSVGGWDVWALKGDAGKLSDDLTALFPG